jgi:ABC-type bacteriocin/lantibiotic exporter with double-glycine peptidase domain
MSSKIQTLRSDRPPKTTTLHLEDAPPANPPAAEVPAAGMPAVGASAPVDPLLGCLSILAGLLERPTSTSALCAGLPMVDEKFTPTLFVRAAERIGIAARLVKREASAISQMNLPCVLLLKNGQACVLTALHAGHGADIIRPEAGASTKRIALSELAKQFRGLVLFAKPEYQFDERTQDLGQTAHYSWFWGTLARFWTVYAHAVVASIVINLFALASPLFFKNVYDRVVPNNAVETLVAPAVTSAWRRRMPCRLGHGRRRPRLRRRTLGTRPCRMNPSSRGPRLGRYR